MCNINDIIIECIDAIAPFQFIIRSAIVATLLDQLDVVIFTIKFIANLEVWLTCHELRIYLVDHLDHLQVFPWTCLWVLAPVDDLPCPQDLETSSFNEWEDLVFVSVTN